MRLKYSISSIFIFTIFFSGCGGDFKSNNYQSYNDIQNSYSETQNNYNTDTDINIIHSSESNKVLDYLNSLRVQTGLHKLYLNQNLTNAANNHSKYLFYNNEYGHREDSNKEYFTGEWASNRAIYSGYLNRFVIENVSTGQSNYKESIDDLFSAIYHRFAFLNLTIDEIGLSQVDRVYTYNMANSLINDRCSKSSYNGGGTVYFNICKDKDKKISKSDLENRLNYYKSNDPALIIWPPKNADNIPPVFFEESPDPLPNYSVSGYPISVEFNDKKIPEVTVDGFSLSDENGNNIELIKLMDKDSDNNSRFSRYQFAIFPKYRLKWGSRYYAHLQYKQNGTTYTKDWCFSTKSLKEYADRFYKISDSSNNITLNIVSNKSYAIYVVPKDGNDKFYGYNIKYNVDKDSFKSGLIDGNTFYFKATGEIGEYVEFELYNYRKIKFIISDSDSATIPKSDICQI